MPKSPQRVRSQARGCWRWRVDRFNTKYPFWVRSEVMNRSNLREGWLSPNVRARDWDYRLKAVEGVAATTFIEGDHVKLEVGIECFEEITVNVRSRRCSSAQEFGLGIVYAATEDGDSIAPGLTSILWMWDLEVAIKFSEDRDWVGTTRLMVR